jgi:hypothetical protein
METGNCIAESTAGFIFHLFIKGIATSVFPLYVHPPIGAELDAVTDVYTKLRVGTLKHFSRSLAAAAPKKR